jgi:dienelactone hydrolase
VLLAEPRADASRVAAVGYCFGGAVVLELARSGADVTAVVGFHPRLATMRPKDAANIRAKVLVFVGTDDPYISAEERLAFEDEMRAGRVDWQMHLYGGAKHSFTRPGVELLGRDAGNEYNQDCDERSWRAMLDLFDEVFAEAAP